MERVIFCPECQSYIGNRDTCDRCHWVRETQAETIGELHWETQVSSVDPIPGAPPFPARISAFGELLFLPLSSGVLTAVDAYSGTIRWHQSFQSNGKRRALSAPLWDDLLLVGTENLGDLPDQECQLLAWDAETGRPRWTWTIQGDSLSVPLIQNDMAYVVSSDQRLYALDLKNRSVCWSVKTYAWSPDQPALSGGIIVPPTRGPTAAAYLAETGGMVWTFEADDMETEMLHQRPAVSEDLVFLAGWGKRVYALDIETGRLRWKFSAERGVTSPPVLAGDLLLIGVKDYRYSGDQGKSGYGLYALEAQTGNVVWKYRTDKHIYSLPVVDGDKVLFGADDRRLHVLDLSSGEEIWQTTLADKVRAGPFLLGNDAVIGLLDNTLLKLQWRIPQPEPGDPAILIKQGKPLEAAAALALSGAYAEAAELYAAHGEMLHAAWLYVEAGFKQQASDIFFVQGEYETALELRQQLGDAFGIAEVMARMGKPAEAAAMFEQAGFFDQAVQAYIQADRQGYAAILLSKAGKHREAAALYRSLKQDDLAAEQYVLIKQYSEAADIYLNIGKPEVAADVLAQGGLLAQAASVNEKVGRLKLAADQYAQSGQFEQAMRLYEMLPDWNMVAQLAEQAGDVLRLAKALKQTGQMERAAQTFEQAGDRETALSLYQSLCKWEKAAAVALSLKKYRQQADALREQGLLMQAGEAYELAAEQLYEENPQDTVQLAELYEAAANCYFEDEEFLRYDQCWDKVCQFRSWPYIKGIFEIRSDFFQGVANSITLIVKNAGYGRAENVRVKAVSQKFWLDEADSEVGFSKLGEKQDKPMRLFIKPRENVLGDGVLWIELSFQDFSGRNHEVKLEQVVKVLGTGLDHSRSSGLILDTQPAASGKPDHIILYDGLMKHFDIDDLDELCFLLKVDFEEISGDNKSAKARNLIRFMQKVDRFGELVNKCKEKRPDGIFD